MNPSDDEKTIASSYQDADGRLHVHKDLVQVRLPWGRDERLGTVGNWTAYLKRFGSKAA